MFVQPNFQQHLLGSRHIRMNGTDLVAKELTIQWRRQACVHRSIILRGQVAMLNVLLFSKHSVNNTYYYCHNKNMPEFLTFGGEVCKQTGEREGGWGCMATDFHGGVAFTQKMKTGTCLAVQWLTLCTSTTRGVASIPGWRAKILHAMRYDQKNH